MGYGYTPSMESVPMPTSGDSWNSFFPHNPFTSDLQPNQRVVHTQVFKLIDVGGLKVFVDGNFSSMELWVM